MIGRDLYQYIKLIKNENKMLKPTHDLLQKNVFFKNLHFALKQQKFMLFHGKPKYI